MTRARIRVLGPLEVEVDGESVRVPRHEQVLVALALEAGRVVPVDQLVDAVWGERAPTSAVQQIRKTVVDLRRLLPEEALPISTRGGDYRLDAVPGALDLAEFHAALTAADRSADSGQRTLALTEAVALWRGPVPAGPGEEVGLAAGRLQQRWLDAVEQLFVLRLDAGAGRELVDELRDLVARWPMRETLRAALMLALYRAGAQTEALAVYDEARRVLADELGIDPGRELTRRWEQILRADPALDGPPPATTAPLQPATLPYDVADFTGRTAEVARIEQAAAATEPPSLRIVSVDGMAGIGKTTVAVHVAHRLAGDFPDGQLYIDLFGHTPGRARLGPGEVLDRLLAAAGLPPDDIPERLETKAAAWRHRTARMRLLVLLDNVAGVEQVRPLLPGGDGCLVLVTGRSRLGSLDGSTAVTLGLPSAAEGRELVGRVLGVARVAAEPLDVAHLVEACGRLPLALRIAAARLDNRPEWSVGYLLERLGHAERCWVTGTSAPRSGCRTTRSPTTTAGCSPWSGCTPVRTSTRTPRPRSPTCRGTAPTCCSRTCSTPGCSNSAPRAATSCTTCCASSRRASWVRH